MRPMLHSGRGFWLLAALLGVPAVVGLAAWGVQVVRGHASKWGFDRTETLTVWRDGRADRGVPPDRPDLLAAEARLKEPLEIRFRPLPPEP